MSEVTQDLLDDIFASVDAAEGVVNDVAMNSCDDESDSDLDVPKPLSPSLQTRSPLFRTNHAPVGGNSLVTRPGMVQRKYPLALSTPNRPTQPSVASGGRVVHQTSKGPSASADYFLVQWRRPQQKKHKTWDGDAYLKIEGSRITMISEEGKQMATSGLVGDLPGPGTELRMGGMDCEVDRSVTFDEFRRAVSCLGGGTPVQPMPTAQRASQGTPLGTNRFTYPKFKTPSMVRKPAAPSRLGQRPLHQDQSQAESSSSRLDADSTPSVRRSVAAASFYSKPSTSPTKIVIGEKRQRRERQAWGDALHDPMAEGAVVMERPSNEEVKKRNTTVIDVVLDPRLSTKMRDHQKEGVQFMYRCVMGMTGSQSTGCILADEMGLGKTLQTISLIYTLCKQSPFANESSVISRAVVVCPVTLVDNWMKEFRKWLPRDFGVTAVSDSDDSKLTAFTHHRGLNVLIIGYERLRKVINKLSSCQPPVDLIVCDEGHRLKSRDNKTTKMFDALSAHRRIILTGTPVQNDLGEYWAMANFVCPGIFGPYQQFNRQYEKPIVQARQPGCPPKTLELGQDCSEELGRLSKEFVLRRTSDVLSNYLPPKSEYVVFVAPSQLQLDVYRRLLGNVDVRGMGNMESLAMIDLLRKVANSPTLLRKKDDEINEDDVRTTLQDALSILPPDSRTIDVSVSGKLIALDRILGLIAHGRDEKVVVVSNWTSTLNIIQELCKRRRYSFLRLDGSTPQKQRQGLVDQFNRRTASQSMVFLLSAKAGGVGLNLIGASRLILFDSDWNPSTDLQAMARIHRDGQKKPVFIYRLLTTNTIDEKIYQRQITKTGLSDQMMGEGGGNKESKDSFSYGDLRDIFSVNLGTDGCQTHDLLECSCGCQKRLRGEDSESTSPVPILSSDDESDDLDIGFMPASQCNPEPSAKSIRKAAKEKQAQLAALKAWDHLDAFKYESFKDLNDNLLHNLLAEDYDQFKTIRNEEAAPPAKRPRRTLVELADEFGNEVAESRLRKASIVLSSDEESDYESVPRRRKRTSRDRSSRTPDEEMTIQKQHDLRKLAQNGQGGRIMFLFEKVSDSKL